MGNSPTEKGSQAELSREDVNEKQDYRMPYQAYGRGSADDEIDLLAVWNILWRGKWLVVTFTLFFAIASVLIALHLTPWYRAEVLLAPSEASATSSIGGQLGGLAALAGVSVGGGESAEAIATLRSRNFARSFIEELDLVPVFFADEWDAEHGRWRIQSPEDWPDVRDAIEFFHDEILRVSEARDSGLVTLSVEWKEPPAASRWAMELARRLNEGLRDRALREAEANVAYLQAELAQTNVVTLQQSIGRLLESELQKLMLARGNEEFAYRVIDAADVPKKPSRPRRALIVILGTMIGGMLGMSAVALRHTMRTRRR